MLQKIRTISSVLCAEEKYQKKLTGPRVITYFVFVKAFCALIYNFDLQFWFAILQPREGKLSSMLFQKKEKDALEYLTNGYCIICNKAFTRFDFMPIDKLKSK